MASDIGALIDDLGAAPVVLIGHSMGGQNALLFAGQNPHLVRALVLVDTGPESSVDGAKEVFKFVQGP